MMLTDQLILSQKSLKQIFNNAVVYFYISHRKAQFIIIIIRRLGGVE